MACCAVLSPESIWVALTNGEGVSLEFEVFYPGGDYGDMAWIYRQDERAVWMVMVTKQSLSRIRVKSRNRTDRKSVV